MQTQSTCYLLPGSSQSASSLSTLGATSQPSGKPSVDSNLTDASSGPLGQIDAGHPDKPKDKFSKLQRRVVVSLIAVTALFSPLSAFVYCPSMDHIAQQLQVNMELMNFTMAVYMLASGIGAAISFGLADRVGRRPVYLFAMSTYLFTNMFLGIQRNFIAMLILRMLQSIGSSVCALMGPTIIAEIATRTQRSKYHAIIAVGPALCPSLGPVIGSIIAHQLGWRFIFYILGIPALICVILIYFFLPESLDELEMSKALSSKPKILSLNFQPSLPFRIPDPLRILRTVNNKNAILIMMINGIHFMTFSCLQGSIATSFGKVHGFSQIHAGLAYLPAALGSAVAPFFLIRMVDHDYEIVSRIHNFPPNIPPPELVKYPIEKARLRGMYIMVAMSALGVTVYGWSLERKWHVSVPLVCEFFVGTFMNFIFSICSLLIMDITPGASFTALAALVMIRSSFAGAGLAVIEILLKNLGIGWTFSIFAGACAACMGLVWMEMRWGLQWREQQEKEKQAQKAETELEANPELESHCDANESAGVIIAS
ncbi:hypothetical protein MFRU_001g01090 [Monilinia fructicola]|nr:hypothetical protein MFRU_001g01090 [Monilinia fructicola]